MTINLSDAHIFKGNSCQLRFSPACTKRRDALLSLHQGKWPANRATNGKRDTIETCAVCARAWEARHPRSTLFRPLPRVR